MNGSLLDTTFNFFVKMKYSHTYDAVLATPLGAARRRDRRDHVGAAARRDLLGRVPRSRCSPSATSVVVGGARAPGAVLIGFGFAGVGLAATTFMRSFVDFDYVNMAMIPLFLFSATFFPLCRYPAGLQAVVRVTPLYQGVVLERSLVLGDLHWTLLLNVAYLVVMGRSACGSPPAGSASCCSPDLRRSASTEEPDPGGSGYS